MGWREHYNTTDSGQRDGSLNDDRTVLYYVDVPAAMAFEPTQPVLTGFRIPVQRGELHPRIPDLFAEDYRITKQTGDSCEVETIYTTDGAAYNASPAIQRKAHRREASFRRVETKIPIIRETRGRLITAPTGSTTRPSYDVDFLTFKESQPVIQIQVTLTSFTDDDLRKIEAQDGAIHLIGGTGLPGAYIRPALFEAGDVAQHGPGKWKVLYTWYSDKGTRDGKLMVNGGDNFPGSVLGEPSGLPNPAVYGTGEDQVKQYRPPTHDNMLQAPATLGPGLMYGDQNKYIRSPFHEVHYILHTNLQPEFTQFFPYRIESNPPGGPVNGLGWRLLPGEPIP